MASPTEDRLRALAAEPGPVLLTAPDELRKERAAEVLCKTFLGESGETANRLAIERHDAAAWTQGDLRRFGDDLQAISLFSAKRCIVVKNIDSLNAAALDIFLPFLDGVPPDVLLVLFAAHLPKTSRLMKHFGRLERLTELPELKGAQRNRWLQQEFARAGISKCSSALLELISAQCSESLDEAAKMIEMLALHAEGGSVSEKDFFALFIELPDPGEFELLDAIQERRICEAEVLLHQLFSAGKSAFPLLGMIYKSYLHCYLVRLLLNRGLSSDEIQAELNLKPWVFGKHLRVARACSAEALRKKVGALLRADSQLKNRSLGTDAIFGELLLQLAA